MFRNKQSLILYTNSKKLLLYFKNVKCVVPYLVQVDLGVVVVREVSGGNELVDVLALQALGVQTLDDLVRYEVLAYASVAMEAEH